MPRVLFWYVPLLVFLGLGLKPVLEVTGFGALLVNLVEKRQAKRWKRIEEQERLKVKQKQRDDKYRHQRVRDPRLPKNW